MIVILKTSTIQPI